MLNIQNQKYAIWLCFFMGLTLILIRVWLPNDWVAVSLMGFFSFALVALSILAIFLSCIWRKKKAFKWSLNLTVLGVAGILSLAFDSYIWEHNDRICAPLIQSVEACKEEFGVYPEGNPSVFYSQIVGVHYWVKAEGQEFHLMIDGFTGNNFKLYWSVGKTWD